MDRAHDRRSRTRSPAIYTDSPTPSPSCPTRANGETATLSRLPLTGRRENGGMRSQKGKLMLRCAGPGANGAKWLKRRVAGRTGRSCRPAVVALGRWRGFDRIPEGSRTCRSDRIVHLNSDACLLERWLGERPFSEAVITLSSTVIPSSSDVGRARHEAIAAKPQSIPWSATEAIRRTGKPGCVG